MSFCYSILLFHVQNTNNRFLQYAFHQKTQEEIGDPWKVVTKRGCHIHVDDTGLNNPRWILITESVHYLVKLTVHQSSV